MAAPSQKYVERYAQGVILRDNTLREYNTFLRNMGENTPLEKIAAEYVKKNGSCRILDIGCGNGQALHELKQHVSSLVHTTGVDLLPLSNRAYLDEFFQGDVHDVPLPSSHIIVSFRALHEMGNFSKLIPRIAHALARGGRAYLWIRFREIIEGKIIFVGEMNTREEAYVNTLTSQREVDGCRVLVESVPLALPSAKNTLHSREVSAGYVVVLLRPS